MHVLCETLGTSNKFQTYVGDAHACVCIGGVNAVYVEYVSGTLSKRVLHDD